MIDVPQNLLHFCTGKSFVLPMNAPSLTIDAAHEYSLLGVKPVSTDEAPMLFWGFDLQKETTTTSKDFYVFLRVGATLDDMNVAIPERLNYREDYAFSAGSLFYRYKNATSFVSANGDLKAMWTTSQLQDRIVVKFPMLITDSKQVSLSVKSKPTETGQTITAHMFFQML